MSQKTIVFYLVEFRCKKWKKKITKKEHQKIKFKKSYCKKKLYETIVNTLDGSLCLSLKLLN